MRKIEGNAAEATAYGSTQNAVREKWKDGFQNFPRIYPFFAYKVG